MGLQGGKFTSLEDRLAVRMSKWVILGWDFAAAPTSYMSLPSWEKQYCLRILIHCLFKINSFDGGQECLYLFWVRCFPLLHSLSFSCALHVHVAHRHGVRVLGTFITEWQEGAKLCAHLLQREETVQHFVHQLIAIAQYYKFDGWLVNIENPVHVSWLAYTCWHIHLFAISPTFKICNCN